MAEERLTLMNDWGVDLPLWASVGRLAPDIAALLDAGLVGRLRS